MARPSRENDIAFLMTVGLVSWVVPGAGYFLLKETKRGTIMFVTIVLTFLVGIYIGSIGVIDLVGQAPLYVKGAQIMNSPGIFVLARFTAGGAYPVYAKPSEIGQIYTMTSGLLNLLCIVNAVYLAHQRQTETAGG